MTSRHKITRDDIMDMADYAVIRKERRKQLSLHKQPRRVQIGPYASFYFESYETMWVQVHEMLYIEKGGEAQIPDELAAYNPLIPNGRELVATLMFEIDDPGLRRRVLGTLGGVEETVSMDFGDHHITADAEADVDRTTADGKASSVQFLHFRFSDDQANDFKSCQSEVTIGIDHPNYPHMTRLSRETSEALAADLD